MKERNVFVVYTFTVLTFPLPGRNHDVMYIRPLQMHYLLRAFPELAEQRVSQRSRFFRNEPHDRITTTY